MLISCQKYRKEEFDTDLENFGEESEWGSEDEWTSEDAVEDDHVADNNDTTKDLLTAFSNLVTSNFKKGNETNTSGATVLSE